MPAGPQQGQATAWTTFPDFRDRLIADCHHLGATVPDDHIIGAEYVQRRVELHRLICWERDVHPAVVDEEVARLRQRWLGEVAAWREGVSGQ